jgi:nucleotide-binding universal stress UspA family protein
MRLMTSLKESEMKDMKSILIPFDFSDLAIGALRFALDLNRHDEARFHLLHVIKMPVLQNTARLPIPSAEEEWVHDAGKHAELRFKELKKEYLQDCQLTTAVRFGDTADSIVEYAADNRIDLVVMGTNGATGLREILIGSRTEKVVRHSDVPVIAIKQFIPGNKISSIVFPVTLDEAPDESLVRKVKSLQDHLKAKLHLLWVNTAANFRDDYTVRKTLNGLALRYLLHDYTINVFNGDDETSGIVNFCRMIDADMIAMGTHGRTGLRHVMRGSIAEDLVNHVSIPVWTCSVSVSRIEKN